MRPRLHGHGAPFYCCSFRRLEVAFSDLTVTRSYVWVLLSPSPFTGLKSTSHADFVAPADAKLRDMFVCPVANPVQVPNPVAARIVLREPNLYERESDNVGSGLPAVVTGH